LTGWQHDITSNVTWILDGGHDTLPGLGVLVPLNFTGTLIDDIFTGNAFGEAYSPLSSIALQHQIDADEGYEARRANYQHSPFSLSVKITRMQKS